MTALLKERLRSHRLTAPARTPVEAARHMLAVQSQDFLAGRWALGIRAAGSATLAAVDAAFDRGELVRTHTMRGTLHTVPAEDVRWVLSVTGERQLRQDATRQRQLGIDDALIARVEAAFRDRLADGGRNRAQLFDDLTDLGIDPGGQRGVHLIYALNVRGILVQGPVVRRDGAVSREQLFVLAEQWIPETAAPADPLAEFFVRYVDGHGPATVDDFAWWSGLPITAAREAVERGRHRVTETADGVYVAASHPRRAAGSDDTRVLALPMFDEYYISYADRSAVASAESMALIGPGKNGMVRASLLAAGRIAGAWTHSAAVGRHREHPIPELFDAALDLEQVAAALRRYADFVAVH
ncbi:winged helix DNA-binding domain-containing protein [Microbacterium capsulatum]|uniref:Winged helix DNA-binding domain-containing protein n=1 Tax=Microbacterium capsulatum TaxID=3041921 RepID=A0ABU0XHJ5_9MICO|nr:winged helix DNA-binding domain-containing protein [Microbacterium sp. ASV81]MDQ4214602.1 winged helix DNA-binding domain-containing protein [Microbacterium sp. ASV81]